MELIFSTGHYSSVVRKSATIMSNATGIVPRLTIAADVRKSMDSVDVFQVTPSLVDMDKQRPEEQKHAWEYELALKNLSEQDLSFALVSKPEQFLSIDFPEGKKIGPGDEKSIKIKVDPAVAEELYTKSITVEASDEAHTRMTIPIMKSMRWGPTTQKQSNQPVKNVAPRDPRITGRIAFPMDSQNGPWKSRAENSKLRVGGFRAGYGVESRSTRPVRASGLRPKIP